MSMIGELRLVPATLIPALGAKATCRSVAYTLMAAEGPSLDKAWAGLWYLLEGLCEIDPLGGVPLDWGDTGYGPPGLLTPDEVQACARTLTALDEAQLREAYDPEAMTAERIYPGHWGNSDDPERDLGWLLDVFRTVRAFYQDAAQRGLGALVYRT